MIIEFESGVVSFGRHRATVTHATIRDIAMNRDSRSVETIATAAKACGFIDDLMIATKFPPLMWAEMSGPPTRLRRRSNRNLTPETEL